MCNLVQDICSLIQNICSWEYISLSRYKIFAIKNLCLNSDTKYLQLKIYFSTQIQKKLQRCCRNVGFLQKIYKKIANFLQNLCWNTKNQYVNFKCNTFAKTLHFNQKDLHLQRFSPQWIFFRIRKILSNQWVSKKSVT